MDAQQIRGSVARLFAAGRARGTRVAVEHELVAADQDTGRAVPIDRIRRAASGASYAAHLGFEPGGQVELSLPTAASAQRLGEALFRQVRALRSDCARIGVRLDALPVDPRHAHEVPLQLTSARYVAMQRHFDTIGPAGRRMMRRTASTQVCLDWWPGAAGLEQWQVLNLAGPFLAAVFARSSGSGSRLATWLAVDPTRTAFDERLVGRPDPIAAYTDFAAGATRFIAAAGLQEHLSTLFPPVRPRGRYLEVRFLDVQREDDVAGVVGALAALVYDDDRRRRALAALTGETGRLGQWWARAALGDTEAVELGRMLLARTGPGPVAAPALVDGAA